MKIWILFFGLTLSLGQAQNEDLLLSSHQEQKEAIKALKVKISKLEKEKALLTKKIQKIEDNYKTELKKFYKEMEKRVAELEKEKILVVEKIQKMESAHQNKLKKVYQEMERKLRALEEKTENSIHGFAYLSRSMESKNYLVKEYKHKRTGIEFILIPGESIEIGSGDGNENEKLQVKSFLISKYEITQAQWRQIMGSNPSHFKGTKRPVETVSWDDAKQFCLKTRLRLPSEEEWEYACRSGTTTTYYWGNDFDNNYANNSSKTMDVGSKKPNAFGLYDMSGNVWEWCEDDVKVDKEWKRIYRGGAWNCGDTESYSSAYRSWGISSTPASSLGFRVARSFFP